MNKFIKTYRRVTGGANILGGIGSGLAYYFNYPVWTFRVLFVFLFILTGSIFALAYIVLWMFTPYISMTTEELVSTIEYRNNIY